MIAPADIDVPVAGGMLRVGVWGRHGSPEEPVLLIHGVTASSRAWQWLADELPGRRLIAPDLRGRGRSRHLPGPVGMTVHARDLVAVLDALGAQRATVVGHSMGAFVALVLADRYPARVSGLVLVDGGLPLELPAGLSPVDAIRRVLGPTVDRLSRTFDSIGDYFDFWRRHPAFADSWSLELEDYFAYDLVGEPPHLRPATAYATVEEDSLDQNAGSAIWSAVERMRHPAVLLAADSGLLDRPPALYPPEHRSGLRAAHPAVRIVDVAGLNHYTIAMSRRGASGIAAEIEAMAISG